MFNLANHKNKLYNTLLILSRNIYFYKNMKLPDTFETRIYLMFFHFSIFLIISKKKNKKFDQKTYDNLFHNIEYNLREQGLGDVTVNKKMKEFNKILYDILLKIDLSNSAIDFKLNSTLIFNYFEALKDPKSTNFKYFEEYFSSFFNFCFELPLDNMIEKAIKFKY
tara:strand:+ start:891 stop:1388 length:498 start_codon:yes stop_codon:yes gene_type:complete